MRSRWLDVGQVLFSRSRFINTQKRTRPISSHLDRPKDLSYGIKHQYMINFPCGTKVCIPRRKLKISLSQREIRFVLHAHGASQIIMISNTLLAPSLPKITKSLCRYILTLSYFFFIERNISYSWGSRLGILVFSLGVKINREFFSRVGCSGQTATILSRNTLGIFYG